MSRSGLPRHVREEAIRLMEADAEANNGRPRFRATVRMLDKEGHSVGHQTLMRWWRVHLQERERRAMEQRAELAASGQAVEHDEEEEAAVESAKALLELSESERKAYALALMIRVGDAALKRESYGAAAAMASSIGKYVISGELEEQPEPEPSFTVLELVASVVKLPSRVLNHPVVRRWYTVFDETNNAHLARREARAALREWVDGEGPGRVEDGT